MAGCPQLLMRMCVFIDSLPITHYPLPIKNYHLPITNYIPDAQFLFGARPEM